MERRTLATAQNRSLRGKRTVQERVKCVSLWMSHCSRGVSPTTSFSCSWYAKTATWAQLSPFGLITHNGGSLPHHWSSGRTYERPCTKTVIGSSMYLGEVWKFKYSTVRLLLFFYILASPATPFYIRWGKHFFFSAWKELPPVTQNHRRGFSLPSEAVQFEHVDDSRTVLVAIGPVDESQRTPDIRFAVRFFSMAGSSVDPSP